MMEPNLTEATAAVTAAVTAAMTELAEDYLGNVSESADVARRVMAAQRSGGCLEVVIGRGDRAKGRILTKAANGQPVGITKGRDWTLREGDVLSTASNKFVLVSLESQQLLALRFEAGVSNQPISLLHLGHTLGNQHWPVTVKGETMYVELVGEVEQMKETLRKVVSRLGIEGLQISLETKSAEESVDFRDDFVVGHVHS